MIRLFLSERYFRLYFFITLGVIEFLATTTIHIEVVESIWDKANHFSAFFVLYILLSFAYKNFNIFIKILLLIGFGIQIEIVQSFIDGREASLLDVVADSAGILIGVLLLPIFSKAFSLIQYDKTLDN